MELNDFFTIVSAADHVLHFEHKGFWTPDVIEKWGEPMLSRLREAISKLSKEGPFIILADLSELDVLSKEGRKFYSRGMQSAKDYGMYKGVEVVPNAVTRLSIREAAELTGSSEFRIVTKSIDEAWDIVGRIKEEMLAGSADQECTHN